MKLIWLLLTLVCTCVTAAQTETGDMNIHDQILAVNKRGESDSVDDVINKVNEGINSKLNIVEGDILIPSNFRAAIDNKDKLWPNGLVPYELTTSLTTSTHEIIRISLLELQVKTCVKFRPKTSSDKVWLRFYQGKGCYSTVGKIPNLSGGQGLSIGVGCESHGVVSHEVMHALGFEHEQSRPDRAKHVKILWENIEEGNGRNFLIQPNQDAQGLNYDFGSVMHYGKWAFSKNDKPTIRALKNPDREFGQRHGPSPLDITRINILYNCENDPNTLESSQWSAWGECDKNCKSKRQRFCLPTDDCQSADSHGIDSQIKTCQPHECDVTIDGNWGAWSGVDGCDDKCSRRRTRECNNPEPENGGANCPGDHSQTEACFDGDCNLSGCNCDYAKGGCAIETAAYPGTACRCKYHGFWTCSGGIAPCNQPGSYYCRYPDKTNAACAQGSGNCKAYKTLGINGLGP